MKLETKVADSLFLYLDRIKDIVRDAIEYVYSSNVDTIELLRISAKIDEELTEFDKIIKGIIEQKVSS